MYWKQLDIPFENHPHCKNMLYLAKHVNIHPLLGYHLFSTAFKPKNSYGHFYIQTLAVS